MPAGFERIRVRSSRTAVLLVGHGSKAKDFDRAMKRVARSLRQGSFSSVRCAYLEISFPSIPDAVRRALGEGAREIRILPYFVLSGRHIREDIPRIVSEERKRWGRKVKIVLCPYLGYDERIVQVVRDRLRG